MRTICTHQGNCLIPRHLKIIVVKRDQIRPKILIAELLCHNHLLDGQWPVLAVIATSPRPPQIGRGDSGGTYSDSSLNIQVYCLNTLSY